MQRMNEQLETTDSHYDQIAEDTIEGLLKGYSLVEIAKFMNRSKSSILAHVSKNPYRDRYARALVSKGMLLADEIVEIVDALPDDPTSGQLGKAKLQVEQRQWVATKFWQHLQPHIPASGLTVNVGESSGKRLVIKAAEPVDNQDVIEIETDSQ